MSRITLDAVILRARDLLWCLALSDVDGYPADRQWLLDELGALDRKSRLFNGLDLYSEVVVAVEKQQRRTL